MTQEELLLQQVRMLMTMIQSQQERLEQIEQRHAQERKELLDRLLAAENPQVLALAAKAQALANRTETPRPEPKHDQSTRTTHFPRDLSAQIAVMGVQQPKTVVASDDN